MFVDELKEISNNRINGLKEGRSRECIDEAIKMIKPQCLIEARRGLFYKNFTRDEILNISLPCTKDPKSEEQSAFNQDLFLQVLAEIIEDTEGGFFY